MGREALFDPCPSFKRGLGMLLSTWRQKKNWLLVWKLHSKICDRIESRALPRIEASSKTPAG